MSRARTVRQGLVLLAASLAVPFGLPLVGAVLLWQVMPLLTPLALLLVPALPALAVAGAKWDAEPSTDQHGQGLTIRGDLPGWARWMQTLDDRLPGGTYEPAVAALLGKVGRFWTSVYWIGWRNRAHGLRRTFGLPSTEEAYSQPKFLPDKDGRIDGVRKDGTWYRERRLGPFKVVTGFRIYRALLKGQPGAFEYIAVPTATIKRS